MKRLRSLGLLLLFVALYAAVVAFGVWLSGGSTIVASGAIMLLAALLVGWLLLTRVERRPLAHLGLSWSDRSGRELFLGWALPCAALGVVTAALVLSGSLVYRADDGSMSEWLAGCLQLLLVLAVPAAAEEVLFRGYPFQKLVEGAGPLLATLLASGGFALAHQNNPGVGTFALINIFLAGVLLSLAYLRTRSLWLPIAIHIGWNWQMAGPLDLPVSGWELFDAPLYEPQAVGAEWLTGGAFGPEGGLAGLIALVLLTAAVLWMTQTRNHGHD